MTKILEEVKQISEEAIAKKQASAIDKLPEILKQIKGAAALGKLSAEFPSHQIDEFVKRLLQAEGFRVHTKTVPNNELMGYSSSVDKYHTVWEVSGW